jgi:tRNA modification GTPase
MYKEDTIAAIATPPGEGGVAIVRVSGPEAERIAKAIFARGGARNGNLRSHTLHYGTIRNPSTQENLDEVLLTIMRKPRSYTGEDVVEVHCHGGSFLVREVLQLILACGARHAEPGEFTKRAFLNGRVDLAQAEGVLDLIRTRTGEGIRLALGQVRGELSKWVGSLREELIDILAQVEAGIDFPEEEIELLKHDELATKINEFKAKISGLIASYEWGRLFREGARVCIIGRPNVGKSSLLNAFLGEQRVIVTPVPGTTRDIIEESINLGGLPVVLCDTAGVRETEDQVERIGVDFTLQTIAKSDAAIVVLDGSLSLTAEDISVLMAAKAKKHLIAINKDDLPERLEMTVLDEVDSNSPVLRISAKSGNGLDRLKKSLRERLLGVERMPEIVLSNFRHKASLERCEQSLGEAIRTIAMGLSAELISVDLQEAQEALEEIVGIVSSDNILEHIFTKFCIGK